MISGGTWLANPASPNRSGLRQKDEIRSLPFFKPSMGLRACQNQDLRGYRIFFRILPAPVFDRQALIRIRLGGISGYGEKGELGESEILKIPLIPLIP